MRPTDMTTAERTAYARRARDLRAREAGRLVRGARRRLAGLVAFMARWESANDPRVIRRDHGRA